MKEKIEITLEKVKRIHYLLSVANNTKKILVSEMAKEMGVKKTTLTEFLLNNDKCFCVCNEKMGLCVVAVYSSADANPLNIEWLERKIKEKENTLYVRQWNCWGQKEEHYIEEDIFDFVSGDGTTDYSMEMSLWRNTKDKMKKFIESGHYHEGVVSVDTFSGRKLPYCLNTREMKALITEGWKLEGEVPEGIEK